MRRIIPLFLVVVFVLSGCGQVLRTTAVDEKQISSRTRNVLVLPLVNLTSTPNAGLILGELLSTEIAAKTNFRMLERSEMMAYLSGGKGEIQEMLEKSTVAKMGKELGMDTVIYGSVTEYRYKKGLDEDPVVGITVRMLDIPENKIIWAESITATGSTYAGRSSLSTLAHELCANLVRSLPSRLK
jgi:hypothetical protein